jgi:pimeloyl-ACP methyl ester carboxylesterase
MIPKLSVPSGRATRRPSQRIAATRWPDKETVNDESQGIRLAEMQALVHYWGTDYDWRKCEAKLNALPEFVTTIDGVDIQFIHVRSREPNALPLILTHGWPGSPLEFLKVIGPLTDPVAYGGRAQDAFDVVIPAIPGYGFSGKPTDLGWNPDRVARAWDVLMKRLGYTRYVAQGGDHGSVISDALARQAPPGLLGIHLTMPATIPANLVKGINSGDPAPTGLTAPERRAYNALSTFFGRNAAYGAMMVTRPQTIGYDARRFAQWSGRLYVRKDRRVERQRRPPRTRDRSRRNTRRHHAVLAHRHRRLFVPLLLGK